MENNQIIEFIKGKLASGAISKEEVIKVVNEVSGASSGSDYVVNVNQKKEKNLSKNLIYILYSIGAIIAVVGIVILVAQNWDEIGFAGRILVTLGISLITFIAGLLFRGNENRVISQIMFIISTVLAPMGIFNLLNEANVTMDWLVYLYAFLALTAVYGTALQISKRNVLVIITLGFATAAYYTLVSKIFADSATYMFMRSDMLKWSTIILGLAYIAIAYGVSQRMPIDPYDKKEKKSLQGIIYTLGAGAILGGGIALGGIFDILFIALLFAVFYLSIYVRSSAVLIVTSGFLVGHIIKLTSRYFVGSIGWPLALIVIGFLVIGVGYFTFSLNRKYIINSSN